MAIYEYYCPTCRTNFEQRRPMSQAAIATTCDNGHTAERKISLFAVARGEGDALNDASEMMGGGGGCCGGGGCACASTN
jgi:putative FmdB family regulatory protein